VNGIPAGLHVRPATGKDAVALAELRWAWAAEAGDPKCSKSSFRQAFLAWADASAAHHLPFLAEVRGDAVGMAWLALVERVPEPAAVCRVGGDLQSVYVIPGLRGRGIGAHLIGAVIAAAAERGLEHLTVRAGRRSFGLYERLGFTHNGRVLELLPAAHQAPELQKNEPGDYL
jgi:GNAT superfamily N-acetyltransferase